MRGLIGVLLILSGIIICVFGGLVYLIYGIWDIYQTWDSITFGSLMWDIFLLLIRDVISICVGVILCSMGVLIADMKKS